MLGTSVSKYVSKSNYTTKTWQSDCQETPDYARPTSHTSQIAVDHDMLREPKRKRKVSQCRPQDHFRNHVLWSRVLKCDPEIVRAEKKASKGPSQDHFRNPWIVVTEPGDCESRKESVQLKGHPQDTSVTMYYGHGYSSVTGRL